MRWTCFGLGSVESRSPFAEVTWDHDAMDPVVTMAHEAPPPPANITSPISLTLSTQSTVPEAGMGLTEADLLADGGVADGVVV